MKKTLYMRMAVAGAMLAASLSPVLVSAATDPLNQACQQDSSSAICQSRGQQLFGPNSFWTNIINTMIYIVGAVSVLMIVVGGLRYTLSGGDSSQMKAAKDTILYAVVGVIVAVSAYAIINVVLERI